MNEQRRGSSGKNNQYLSGDSGGPGLGGLPTGQGYHGGHPEHRTFVDHNAHHRTGDTPPVEETEPMSAEEQWLLMRQSFQGRVMEIHDNEVFVKPVPREFEYTDCIEVDPDIADRPDFDLQAGDISKSVVR